MKKLLFFVCLFLWNFNSFSQDWQLGGNGLTPPPFSVALPNNQLLGTTVDFPLRVITNDIQRLHINPTTGMTPGTGGFIGIGDNFINPLFRLDVDGQINMSTSVFIPNTGYRINGNAVLQNKNNNNLFVGNQAGFSFNNSTAFQQNTFVGDRSAFSNTNGGHNTFVGFETGFFNVSGRNNTFMGYRAGYNNVGTFTSVGPGNRNTFIGNQSGFENTTGSQNTFIGDLSGRSNTDGVRNTYVGAQTDANSVGTGDENTFLGFNSGRQIADGDRNTFIGALSGQNLTDSDWNTMGGFRAGFNIVNSNRNVVFGYRATENITNAGDNVILGHLTAFNLSGSNRNIIMGRFAGFDLVNANNNIIQGHQAARFTNTGSDNVYLGRFSARSKTNGNNNVFVGRFSGEFSTTGNNSVYLGNESGRYTVGNLNTFVGYRSGNNGAANNLTNASGIGANAIPTGNNEMILGDNTVNVGIGLSDDANGPNNKLEINNGATVPTSPNIGGGTGFSGLRFRDLTANSTPYTSNPGAGVLALDGNGDVIYVPDGGGSGGGGDHDWYLSNTTNIPGTLGDIDADIYTNGLVGINQFNTPLAQLHINPNGQTADPLRINGANALMWLNLNGNLGFGANASNQRYINISDVNVGSAPNNGLHMELSNTVNDGIFLQHLGGTDGTVTGIYADVKGTNFVYGIFGDARKDGGNYHHGVYGRAENGLIANYGVYGVVTTGGQNLVVTPNSYGVYSKVDAHSVHSTGVYTIVDSKIETDVVIGVHAESRGISFASTDMPTENYGGYFRALWGENVYGIYAQAGPSNTGTVNQYAAYFVGSTVMGSQMIPSDAMFKENVNNLSNPEQVINGLNPVNYTYKTTGNAEQLNFPAGNQVGFIAQDVEQVNSDLVSEVMHPTEYDSVGNVINPAFTYKAVDYVKVIPYMVGNMQDNNQEIDSLENVISTQDSLITDLNDRLTLLENCLSGVLTSLCEMSNSDIHQNSEKTQEELGNVLNVELTDNKSIILDQNVPNPFAEQTTIFFTIPETVQKAQIMFYNSAGQLIKVVDVDQRGFGQINVFGPDLSAGIYTYTLVVDGNIAATKKMIKTESK